MSTFTPVINSDTDANLWECGGHSTWLFYIVWLNQCLSIWSLFQDPSTCCNLQNIGEAVSNIQQNSNSLFYKALHAYMTYCADAYYASAMILLGLLHVLTAVLHIGMDARYFVQKSSTVKHLRFVWYM